MNAILMTHYIDPITLRQDDFEGFMLSRQRMILNKIESAIGKPVLISDDLGSSKFEDDEE
jgi:hypothetical protein